MFSLEETTLCQIQDAMNAGEISARELALLYMERIAHIDACDNGLNAVLEINPDAISIANDLDNERAAGHTRGLLHGVPVLLKDNINTADKTHTSAGSLALTDHFAPYEADIIGRLRNAGAVILGKTNMTEFANFMSEDMPDGYSSRGGQVLNPYNRDKSPSGSSSGSAVAVAANLCAVSVGTETCGSIIAPSQANGIVGIKPTSRLLCNDGIVPISCTLDTAGPMARTVYDAAVLLGVLAGKEFIRDLSDSGLRNVRIGLYGLADANDLEYKKLLDNAICVLRESGATIVENIPAIEPVKMWRITKHEFKRCMNYYLSTLGANARMRTLDDIICFNQEHAETALKYGHDVLLDCSYESGRMTEPEYADALRKREVAIHELDKTFTDYNLDILLCATEYTEDAPLTGFPSATIPIGFRTSGVPAGTYWIARRYDEIGLLRVLFAAEQLLRGRRKP